MMNQRMNHSTGRDRNRPGSVYLYSTFTRLIYFTNQLKALEGLSIKDYLVGKGVEENKKVGYNISEFNFIDQHNDFFVLILRTLLTVSLIHGPAAFIKIFDFILFLLLRVISQ